MSSEQCRMKHRSRGPAVVWAMHLTALGSTVPKDIIKPLEGKKTPQTLVIEFQIY